MTHNFKEQLDFSEKLEDEIFWEKAYRNLFSNFVNQMPCHGDTESQRRGIDRIIHLANGTTLTVDEKKRSEVYYQNGELDFALEYISNDSKGTPGWIEKELDIDFIAYAWMPIGRVELLPWWPLHFAWFTNKNDWVKTYRRVEAKNESYTTISVAVPRKIVWQAIAHASKIILPQFSQEENAGLS